MALAKPKSAVKSQGTTMVVTFRRPSNWTDVFLQQRIRMVLPGCVIAGIWRAGDEPMMLKSAIHNLSQEE